MESFGNRSYPTSRKKRQPKSDTAASAASLGVQELASALECGSSAAASKDVSKDLDHRVRRDASGALSVRQPSDALQGDSAADHLKSQISDAGDPQPTTHNPRLTSTNPKSQIQNPKSAVGATRRVAQASPPADGSPLQTINLLPYQRRWVEDDSKLKIVIKARQIGYSFAATLRAVFKCLEHKTTWIFLSKGERQSRLLMEKVQDHIRSCGIVARCDESTFFEGTSLKQLEVRFPNGSVIYGLPANPDTARGYSGNVTLDEFAFHADADKIYAALFPTITRGYGLEVISTPNGTQGKFYELARAAGLTDQVSGVRCQAPGQNPDTRSASWRTPGTWSSHSCDIYDALRDGLKIDINLLRSGCEDSTAWQQEFCCQFVSTAENFFSPDLLASCLSAEATTDFPLQSVASATGMHDSLMAALRRHPAPLTGLGPASAPPAGEAGVRCQVPGVGEEQKISGTDTRHPGPDTCFYLGIDIGRRHDRTVMWVDEVAPPQAANGCHPERSEGSRHSGDLLSANDRNAGMLRFAQHDSVAVARLVRTLENTPFAEQLQAARELLSLRADAGAIHESSFLIRRCSIDATGIGAHMAETLQREFGPRVEPVVFTAAVKEDLAFRTKRRMEARLTLLPDTREIRRAFSAVKKFITPSGNLRFDAVRTEAGHADEFWAKALADLAADPEAHQLAARAADAFLADATPLISPLAFREVDANWSQWLM